MDWPRRPINCAYPKQGDLAGCPCVSVEGDEGSIGRPLVVDDARTLGKTRYLASLSIHHGQRLQPTHRVLQNAGEESSIRRPSWEVRQTARNGDVGVASSQVFQNYMRVVSLRSEEHTSELQSL